MTKGSTEHVSAPRILLGSPGNGHRHAAIEIAIYPDIIRLAGRNLRAHHTSHREAPGQRPAPAASTATGSGGPGI